MNSAAGGKKPIMAHAITRMLVRMGQFSAAMHGEASLQESHPSAQGRHSNIISWPYKDNSPWGWKRVNTNWLNIDYCSVDAW